jgi:hypothetical protein
VECRGLRVLQEEGNVGDAQAAILQQRAGELARTSSRMWRNDVPSSASRRLSVRLLTVRARATADGVNVVPPRCSTIRRRTRPPNGPASCRSRSTSAFSSRRRRTDVNASSAPSIGRAASDMLRIIEVEPAPKRTGPRKNRRCSDASSGAEWAKHTCCGMIPCPAAAGSGTSSAGGLVFGADENAPIHAKVSRCPSPKFRLCPPPIERPAKARCSREPDCPARVDTARGQSPPPPERRPMMYRGMVGIDTGTGEAGHDSIESAPCSRARSRS